MKATDLLEKQHREVDALFKRSIKATDPATRRALRDEITEKLKMHTTIEEKIFYPAVRAIGTKKVDDMIGEAVEEHHVVKLVLGELPRVDPKADTFKAKMTVLSELVEHHVEEERKEMFPTAEKKLGADSLEELSRRMQQRMMRPGDGARRTRARSRAAS